MNRDEWSTYSEIQFLKNVLKKKERKDQTIFIEKYSENMKLRSNWDNINKIEVESFLNRKRLMIIKGEY